MILPLEVDLSGSHNEDEEKIEIACTEVKMLSLEKVLRQSYSN